MCEAKNKQQHDLLRDAALSARQLVSSCVNGLPLSWRQTNILMDVAPGFRDLAIGSFEPESEKLMQDYLGPEDGSRVISFFIQGPKQAL